MYAAVQVKALFSAINCWFNGRK